jgi:hypothetical protein
MQENDSHEKVIYMGDVQGPEKVNNTCIKTKHAGMMDRGFNVIDFCGSLFHHLNQTEITCHPPFTTLFFSCTLT